MKTGLVGFPGSGKSTVFQALAPGAVNERRGVALGNVKVPDERVDFLASIFEPKKITYAETTFVDVSGSGADTKALSSATLEAMKQVDLLVVVLRVFENPMLGEGLDPMGELRAFREELLLHDLDIVERRVARLRKEKRKDAESDGLERCLQTLEAELPLTEVELTAEMEAALSGYQLLSGTPLFLLSNFGEDQWEDSNYSQLKENTVGGLPNMAMLGAVEAELTELEPAEQSEFLASYGVSQPSSSLFLQRVYSALDLISFLTSGPDECRAWTIRRDTIAQKAAGKIHSDIERGFIRAEVMSFDDFKTHGSEAAVKKAGAFRVEGKEYPVQDGEIINFRFNV